MKKEDKRSFTNTFFRTMNAAGLGYFAAESILDPRFNNIFAASILALLLANDVRETIRDIKERYAQNER